MIQTEFIGRQHTAANFLQNSSHRPPPYFEWFYFHFATADGVAITLVLHETDIFGLQQAPYLSMTVLIPAQEPQYLRHDLKDTAIVHGGPHLRVGEGIIIEDDQAICLDVPFPGRGLLRAEITKLAPPLVIEDGVLYHDPNNGRSSNWVVQTPHATFTGILQLDGTIHRLSGTAYQDHQWGTLLIQEFVSDWVWGHFSNDQMAVMFFQILTQHGQFIERVAMMSGEGRYVGTAVETSHLDTLFQAGQPEEFDARVRISFLNNCCWLEIEVSSTSMMRSRVNEEHQGNVASYLRWSAAAILQTGCDNYPLHGISEYIRIRPAMYGSLS